MLPHEDLRAPYCLHCYAPMERMAGASEPCPRCGRPNLKDDQRRFWTREPRLVRLQGLANLGVTAAVVSTGAAILFHPGVGTGRGHGMAVGLPILLGVLGWDAASGLTRRTTMWRSGLVLAGVLAVFGLLTAVVAAAAVRAGRWADSLGIAGLAILLCAAAFAAFRAGPTFARWRQRYVARAQADLASSTERSPGSAVS